MNIDNFVIDVYNNAIKQCIYLDICTTKENIKKISENNIYFIKTESEKNEYLTPAQKDYINNFYNKVIEKILSL